MKITTRTTNYHGWRVTFATMRPVTGLWRAEKHGVELSAGTFAALCAMLDARAKNKTLVVR